MWKIPAEHSPKTLAWMGALIVGLVAIGLGLEAWLDSLAPVSVALGAVGVITYFGFITLVGGIPAVIERQELMRAAITATFVVVYVVLLGLLVFFRGDDAPDISKTLVTNFTVLMGVIVAFYFGATTYEKVKLAQREGSKPTAEPASDATNVKPESSERL